MLCQKTDSRNVRFSLFLEVDMRGLPEVISHVLDILMGDCVTFSVQNRLTSVSFNLLRMEPEACQPEENKKYITYRYIDGHKLSQKRNANASFVELDQPLSHVCCRFHIEAPALHQLSDIRKFWYILLFVAPIVEIFLMLLL